MDEYYELIPIDALMPEGTDFCMIMDSELMEPLIKKGQRLHISRSSAPAELEVGIFYYKGQIYCRQYCEDYAGNMHLLCANPGREKDNLCLDKSEKAKCRCLGRVLLKERPPMPVYV